MTIASVLRACVLACMWRVEPATSADVGAWRLVETRAVHVGLRPAVANEGVGLTLQVSVRVPW